MVIGLPRSGTTWAANWLTTDQSHCVHDPLYTTHYTDWETDGERFPRHRAGLRVGVSCTGIWRWPAWLNAHPARKVVLRRDLRAVRDSMRAIGLPEIEDGAQAAIDQVSGLHVPYTDLFNAAGAARIWAHLLPGLRFNADRHAELVQIEMQPHFAGLSVGPEVTRRLMDELSRIGGGV